MSELHCALRPHRRRRGLSQAELADRVGVSRQALIAIEQGRQVPSTRLALQLARALGCAVEELFTLPDGPIQATLARGEGSRVALGCVDGRWAAHPLGEGSQAGDGLIERAAVRGGSGEEQGSETVPVQPLGDPWRLERNVLVAGCAPLLGLLAGHLGHEAGETRATWLPAHSARSLDLLAAGLVHIAGLHLVQTGTPGGHEALVRARFPGQGMTLLNLTRWRQGLVLPPGNPLGIAGVRDLLAPGLRTVSRSPGSGAAALLRRLLGRDPPPGPLAQSHEEVARMVRWGVADAGIAIESAALDAGLTFLPLAEERFDLLLPTARADQRSVSRLLGAVSEPSFRADAARLRGYDLSESGHASTVAP